MVAHTMLLRQPTTFWYSVALLVACTIGIGMYGMPYVFAQAGFGVGFLFLIVLTIFLLTSNLLYGEIILRTHTRHQFVGYIRRYLGPWAHYLNLFNFWISMYGSFLGILVVNGKFLSSALATFHLNVSPSVLAISMFLLIAFLAYAGLKTVSHVDLAVMLVAVAIVFLIGIFGVPHFAWNNFYFSTGTAWFLPFGVILFALNGLNGIPLMREVLVGKERLYRRAIVWGTLIPAVLYLVFILTVVGVSGQGTSPEAISGLLASLGPWIVFIGSLFGFLTSTTIFLSLLTSFRTSLREDFQLRRKGDFLLPLLPPLVFFLLGVQNFIGIISLVGGVAVSIDMILLLFVYAKAKNHGDRIPEYSISIPKFVLYGMMLIFALGAIYTLVI